MDRVIIDIITLIIGANTVFVYYSRYSPPQLSNTFIGSNPYARKAQIVNGALTGLFAVLALIAIFLQIGKFIFEDDLPPRAYGSQVYFIVSLVSILVTASTTLLTKRLTRRRWFPDLVNTHQSMYKSVEQVIRNDGLRDEQLRHQHPGKEQAERQLKEASQRLEQIETLLEIRLVPGATLQERLEKVRPIFEPNLAVKGP